MKLTKNNMRVSLMTLALIAVSNVYAAGQFDSGIPASWACTGNCGTSADIQGNSVVTPLSTAYGWVSTANGVDAVSPFVNVPGVLNPDTGLPTGIGNTNGSLLRSNIFSASSGEVLKFEFNYVTSDGGSYADYAWARLLNANDLSQAAVIFTARTNTDTAADVIPGFGLPNPDTTLSPTHVPIIDVGYDATINLGPNWSALGSSDGTCYSSGCGYTGWVGASYSMSSSGNYILEFGVTNWDDQAWDSGLAFNTVTIGKGTGLPGDDVEIEDDSRNVSAVPEPETYAMLIAGIGMLGNVVRRRRK